jgi:hypothetical protein
MSQPTLPADTPAELASICLRAMQADPAARFASVEDMRLALVAYLEQRGSARLLEVASERLARLLEVLETARTDPAEHGDEIHRLFGACRFGFHEALVVWRDNTDAQQGLVRATVAVAEHELRVDNPRRDRAAIGARRSAAELIACKRAVADRPRSSVGRAPAPRHAAIGTNAHVHDDPARQPVHDHPAHRGDRSTLLPFRPATRTSDGRSPSSCSSPGSGSGPRSMMATVLNRRGFVAIEGLFLAQILLLAASGGSHLDRGHRDHDDVSGSS